MVSRYEVRATGRAAAALLAFTLALVPASGMAAAGRIHFAFGQVTGIAADGQQRSLAKGSAVHSGDTIKVVRGRAQIRFADGAFTSLLPNTELRIDDYRFEAKAKRNRRSFFSLLRGGLRTITGLIGKRRAKSYRVRTPLATIGIRGTQFLALLIGNSLTLQVTVPPTSGSSVELTPESGQVLVVAPGQTAICEDSSGECSLQPTTALLAFADGTTALVPQLFGPYAQPNADPPPVPPNQSWSVADNVNPDGTAAIVPPGGSCTGAARCMAFAFGNSDGDFGVELLGLASLDFVDPSVAAPVVNGFTTTSGQVVTRNVPGSAAVTNAQQGKADGLTWGRWRASGALTGGAGGPAPFPVKITGGGGGGGLMYVTGVPTADMPTSGIARFSPSCSPKCAAEEKFNFTTVRNSTGGGGGDLRSGGLAVDFGRFKVGADLTIEHQDAAFTYNIRTTGGLADPSKSQISILGNTFSDTAPLFATSATDCATGSGCRTNLKGFFSGAGASAAGIAYRIKSDTQGHVFGAAAFKKD